MTAHIPVMQVAFELVQQAEAAGIAIESSYAYRSDTYADITLLPARDADAPALAALLGLTSRRTHPYDNATTLEAFYGMVGDIEVKTQWSYPTPVEVTA